jgi:uncharacterized RDD family membrane protein YckC
VACQFCSQVEGLPEGVRISTAGRRFAGFLLEWLIFIFTAITGWFIWSMFTWRRGQTPAKQLLDMRCVKLRTDRTASWGTMCVREVIAKPVIGVLSWAAAGIVNFWLVWDVNTQELWDKMVGTIVVDDPMEAVEPDRPRERQGAEDDPDWASPA